MSPLYRNIRRSIVPYRVPIGPAELYLDDIQEILKAVKASAAEREQKRSQATTEHKEGSSTDNAAALSEAFIEADVILAGYKLYDVHIVAADAIADSVEDLREATPEELNHLSIIGYSPRIEIDLWHNMADIETDSSDSEARILADDIARFVNRKRPWHYPWLDILRVSGIFWLGALAILIFAGVDYERHHSHPPWLGIVGAVFFAVIAVAEKVRFKMQGRSSYIRIHPVKRSESRRVSERTRRDIAIAVVASVVGAIVLGMAGLWAGLFVK